MGNPRGVAGASRARSALVVAALALFGLLSMHGWGTHAGMHSDPSPAPAPVTLAHAGDHPRGLPGAHGDHGAGGNVAADAAAVGCDDSCHGTGSGGGMGLAGLCLAVLGGLLLGLALLLVRRGTPLVRTMVPAFHHPIRLGRERDPPDLLRLCVIRC
ncbi:DUF6153 family protein [Nocardioides stalactiti]|uniref:DUF6153 family protein n=1 Tax=Nocardioides stalactiti TaxID=2755356 RepID=UPI0015FF6B85|nr:DUF6153 family protein [Nocardioides stalactiti]